MFLFFSELPDELRGIIWNHAIQNRLAEPEAHFFSLDQPRRWKTYAYETVQDHRFTITGGENSTWSNDFFPELGPPTFRGRTLGWGPTDNASGYVLDSGLWRACHESRFAILWSWRSHNLDQGSLRGHKICLFDVESRSSHQRLIAMRPERDLFVLQVRRFTSEVIDIVANFFAVGGPFGFFNRVNNIALEYDPNWLEQLDELDFEAEDFCDTLVNSSGSLGAFGQLLDRIKYGPRRRAACTLLLVDTELKPKEGVKSSTVSGTHETFLGNRRRYVVIEDWSDMHKHWVLDDYEGQEGAFDFVLILKLWMEVEREERLMGNALREDLSAWSHIERDIRVLGVVYDD